MKHNMIVALAVAAAVLAAGCVGPGTNPKGTDSGLTAEELLEHRVFIRCSFKSSGLDNSVTARVIDCSDPELKRGSVEELVAEYDNEDKSLATKRERSDEIFSTVYWSGGNTELVGEGYKVPNGDTHEFDATFEWTPVDGFGTYTLFFELGGHKDVKNMFGWTVGHKDLTTTHDVDVKLSKKGVSLLG